MDVIGLLSSLSAAQIEKTLVHLVERKVQYLLRFFSH